MADITFNIKKHFGVISEGIRGNKEVNLVSWNGRKPKVDIREWDEEHEKMGKGITLTKEEIVKLKEVLAEIELDELEV